MTTRCSKRPRNNACKKTCKLKAPTGPISFALTRESGKTMAEGFRIKPVEQAMTSDLKILWPLPPAIWHLGEREIHVWAIALNQPPAQIASFAATLAPDELARAARFHFDRDRNRFIIGR